MKNKNDVNYLNGKEWLKNAVNFWVQDSDDIDAVFDRCYLLCYKDRTGTGFLKNTSSYLIKQSDFSFNYIDSYDDIKNTISVIFNGAYNSYHVAYFDNEIIDHKFFIPYLTKNLSNNGIEYRGKILVYSKNNNHISYCLLFLNRGKSSSIDINNYCLNISNDTSFNYMIESKSKIDKIGLKHPAPYSYIDIKELCKREGIFDKTILDPFLGIGSTIIGTYENNYNIGIELSEEYVDLIKQRFDLLGLPEDIYNRCTIIQGDSLKEIDSINQQIDCVITSPPYFNILKNKTDGVRTDNSQSRQGVEYYSEKTNDIGNSNSYYDYLSSIQTIFAKIKNKLSCKGDVYIVISDFTIDKKETDVHSDYVRLMLEIGYKYIGTSYIFQNQKAIYPFGYPYKIVINHIFQYIMKFEV